MTTAQLYKYALQGVNDEIAWLTPPWNQQEVHQQRKLLRLRQQLKRWQIKHQLRQQGKWQNNALDFMTFNKIVRDTFEKSRYKTSYYKAITADFRKNPSKPLPLP